MYCVGCGKELSEGEQLYPKAEFPRNYVYAEKFCGGCNETGKAFTGAVPKFCYQCGGCLDKNPFDELPEEHQCPE